LECGGWGLGFVWFRPRFMGLLYGLYFNSEISICDYGLLACFAWSL
jgi:hypothetical protein